MFAISLIEFSSMVPTELKMNLVDNKIAIKNILNFKKIPII